MSERTEALWRILVGFVAFIIWGVWSRIMVIVWLVHWLIVIFTDKRVKDLSEFNDSYITYTYKIYRYMGFSTNARPWPFAGDFPKPMEKYDMNKPKN